MRGLLHYIYRNKGFIAFMICLVMFRSAFADWSVVPTGSMQPTIRIGDRIVVDKMAYDIRLPLTHISLVHLADPQRGDIVVLDSHAAGERLVKRVIGLPGDVVVLRNNALYVNGVAATYSSIRIQGIHDDQLDPARYAVETLGDARHLVRLSLYRPGDMRDFGPVSVPPGQYLLMGDDRDNSEDSRYLGFFPRQEIVGRSRYVALSLDPDNHYLPRKERFAAQLDGQTTTQGPQSR